MAIADLRQHMQRSKSNSRMQLLVLAPCGQSLTQRFGIATLQGSQHTRTLWLTQDLRSVRFRRLGHACAHEDVEQCVAQQRRLTVQLLLQTHKRRLIRRAVLAQNASHFLMRGSRRPGPRSQVSLTRVGAHRQQACKHPAEKGPLDQLRQGSSLQQTVSYTGTPLAVASTRASSKWNVALLSMSRLRAINEP